MVIAAAFPTNPRVKGLIALPAPDPLAMLSSVVSVNVVILADTATVLEELLITLPSRASAELATPEPASASPSRRANAIEVIPADSVMVMPLQVDSVDLPVDAPEVFASSSSVVNAPVATLAASATKLLRPKLLPFFEDHIFPNKVCVRDSARWGG